MPLLRRVNESQYADDEETIWRPVGEGFWRFEIGKADLKADTKGKLRVRFPLMLTPDEQKRQTDEADELPEGHMQSTRTYYRPGLSLGFRQQGVYQPTMLIDFLCAALGTENGKKFRKWIEAGGGPARPDDPDDDKAEQEQITQWVGWWEGLEVYGTITHSDPDVQGRVWANFAGPMPLGSLPGQPEPDYQALCRGKFRAMVSENFTPAEPETVRRAAPARTATADRPPVRYTADGSELPF